MVKKLVDIEDLTRWAIHDQRADFIISRGVGLLSGERAADGIDVRGVSGCGCVQIERSRILGVDVDGGGWCPGRLNEDAEEIYHDIVGLACGDVPDDIKKMIGATDHRHVANAARGIVLDYARAGTRPDWMRGSEASMIPVLNEKGRRKGKPKMILNRNGDTIACRITVGISQRAIDSRRGMYALWRWSLAALAVSLRGRLDGFDVCGPRAPAKPWDDYAEIQKKKIA